MQMAEPTCLMRSFSQPSESSREFNEGDPARCLGESISFGRYMSEPLAWEKWSAFSNNRYLEEAEKSSKPGSVAKMKAYFEAYYKSIANRKRVGKDEEARKATALEVNGVAQHSSCSVSNTPQEVDSVSDKPCKEEDCNSDYSSSFAAPGIEEARKVTDLEVNDVSQHPSCSVSNTSQEVDSISDKPCNEEDCNSGYSSSFAAPGIEESRVLEDTGYIAQVNALESCAQLEVDCSDGLRNSPQLGREPSNELVQLKCTSEVESSKEGYDLEKLNSKVKPGDPNTGRSDISKPPIPLEIQLLKKGDDNQKSLTLKTKKLPDSNFRTLPYCKPSKLPKSSGEVVTSQPSKEGRATPRTKQQGKDTLHLKAVPSSSINRSNKFGPHVDVIKKSSQFVQKSLNEIPLTPSTKITRNKATPVQTPKNAYVTGKLKYTSATPRPEIGRSISTPGRSLSRGGERGQELPSPSLINMKPSSSRGLKARASVTFSPFNFRTEERAAKRKEFFQKLQEKEAGESKQPDKAKERVNTARKLLNSVGLNAKSTLNSNVKSSTQEICTYPKPRPLKQSDALKLKAGKNDLSKKIRHENTSPNII